MKFFLYTKQLFSPRSKSFIGTIVKMTKDIRDDLDNDGYRRHTLFGNEQQYSRWERMFSFVTAGDDSIVPQTEEQLISKMTGVPVKPKRTVDWESKIEEYKVYVAA